MKKRILFFAICIVMIGGLVYTLHETNSKTEAEILREKHAYFLENSPFEKTKKLSRAERKSMGLPPNAYNEQMWELTMDPSTGRPMPERVFKLQQKLKESRENISAKGGAGDSDKPWVDRGPNNVGGRTRGIMFDPNDNTNKRVFAGGVSGGLWVNNDITNANSSWTLVSGIEANISVNTIISDPINSNVFYIGSGESYTSGNAVGRGVWKSSDGGVTWTNIFGGFSNTSGSFVDGIFYINDIVARDVGTSTELFIAVSGAFYSPSSSPNQVTGLDEQGVYKSIDNGVTWSKFTLLENDNTSPINPNDLEIDLNNNLWLTTTRNNFNFNGGKIYKSTDGTSFTLINTIPNARRTELEPSSKDPQKFWVAVDVGGQADLYSTSNSFATITKLNEPADADTGIPDTDYTRGQAFYDLPIEVDSNDNIYVGGIDLFRSLNGGNSWTQISKWSNNNNLSSLNVPLIHADHHAIVFRPGDDNQAVLGNDGGIYYSSDLLFITINTNTVDSRNKDYNVTQFYYGSIDRSETEEILYGGTQDNGTIISQNSTAGANDFDNYFAFFSGDGSYSEIDQNGGLVGFGTDGEYMIVGSVYANYYVASPSTSSSGQAINNGYEITQSGNTEGDFINSAELDHVGNILYANTSDRISNIDLIRFSAFTLSAATSTRRDFLSDIYLTASPTAFKVSPFTNTTLLLGTEEGKLIQVLTANPAARWSDISSNDFVGSISDIEYGVTPLDIFVTFHNYGVKSVWYTNDGGTTWQSIEGNLPDLPVKCILQNPLLPSELIIGTELGVWRTEDFTVANPVWSQAYNGMSDVTVLDLDLRASDNTILATTHGRGMFTSQFTANPASVDEVLAGKKTFSIYPTISNGNFTLFAKNSLGKSKMNIFNLNGKQVYTSNIDFNTNEKQEVSVNLNAGVYIVNLIDENNKQSSNKIIIE